MSTPAQSVVRPGAEAIAARGWLAAHKWLLLRRSSQVGLGRASTDFSTFTRRITAQASVGEWCARYSARSAVMGCTRPARNAGMALASRVTAARITAVPVSATGSSGDTS